MTNQENTGPESMGSYSLDEEDQLRRRLCDHFYAIGKAIEESGKARAGEHT